MQKKGYGFSLPRTITREQWRKIHSGARQTLRTRKDPVKYLCEKYGADFTKNISPLSTIHYFWDLASHKKYEPFFIKAAIKGNTHGLTRSRTQGVVKSLSDPDHPHYQHKAASDE